MRGSIAYTSVQKERIGATRGREYFTMVVHSDGTGIRYLVYR